jgi:hypothetical protein
MPDPVPDRCPQCDRRPWELDGPEYREWVASKGVLCPFCVRHWAASRSTGPTSPRCAGCGKRTTALQGDLCGECRHHGIEALTLFPKELHHG